jgi:hypothetical protein
MKPGPYAFRVHRQSWSRYELLLAKLGAQQLDLKRGLAAVKAAVDQGELPDDADILPDIESKPAFALSLFGYRFHFCRDEALMSLVVMRIDDGAERSAPEP